MSLRVRRRMGDPALQGWVAGRRRALDHAHAFAVIHRDLTPVNVLFRYRDDRALPTDVGVTRALSDLASRTTRVLGVECRPACCEKMA